MFKRIKSQFRVGEKGFTMIELLVVIAVLGVLAAVAIPNVGKFIGQGKTEAYEAELHNVQTGAMAMLADSTAGVLDATYAATADMTTILADSGTKNLSQYLSGLSENGSIKTGCSYAFATDGTVTHMLRAHFREPVEVRVEAHDFTTLDEDALPWLEASKGREILVLYCPRREATYKVSAITPDDERIEQIQNELAGLLYANAS